MAREKTFRLDDAAKAELLESLAEADRGELIPADVVMHLFDLEGDAHDAWAAEIDRRIEDYRAGRVKTLVWEDLQAQLRRSNP